MKHIGRNVVLSDDTVMGEDVTLGNNVTVYPGVTIGDRCTILDGAVLGRPPRSAGNNTRPLPPFGPLTIGSDTVIGANAVLYNRITIGRQVLIGDLAAIREGCSIADHVVVGRGAMLYYDTVLGERTRISDGVILGGTITVEPNVFMGMGVRTINDNAVYLSRFSLTPFTVCGPSIRRFALIGTGATLAGEVEIGMGAIVAPAAMVTRSVPAWSVAAGVPARVVRPIAEAQRERILHHFGLNPLREAS
jgi:acetyltransferase-like isoleucine patch superfamily enzyme